MDGRGSGSDAEEAERLRIVDEAEGRQLPVLIAEWWDAPDRRRWIARALRIDLALLTERPELVVPCLQRRCAWLGAPAETAFYSERPEVPAEAAALRELMRGWGPGRPWLRTLRPPPVPLDAGVVEEYWTEAAGALAFSADGAWIGVVGGEGRAVVAWERVTGRRIAPPARAFAGATADTDAPRWRAESRTWGRMVFVTDAPRPRRVDLQFSDDEIDRGWWQIGPELVLADLDFEHDHHATLFDLSRGCMAWQHAVECTAVIALPDGEAIAIGSHHGIDVLELATGEVRGSWSAPEVSALAISADGLLASRSHGVIRVWDPALAAARASRLAGRSDLNLVELSIDGARLLTGGLLCDGRTGAVVAHLGLRGYKGWLEGGPPQRNARLTTTLCAEILPFGLTLWDAASGRLVSKHEHNRARHGDLVAFDPIGQHYAIAPGRWASRPRELQVYELRSGALVYSWQVEPRGERADSEDPDGGERGGAIQSLGFSSDGDRLWWQTAAGERWVLELPAAGEGGGPVPRLLADDEPLPAEPPQVKVATVDGLLAAGGAAIPCDDPVAIASMDGRCFASRTGHYVLEDG